MCSPNPIAFLQARVFLSDLLFFLFPRFNLCCSPVASFDAAFFYPWIVTKQEPPLDSIFSKQSCLVFIRVTPEKCLFSSGSPLLRIVGMNDSTDHVHGPILIKSQPCV